MRVTVTGATGMLGRQPVEELLQRGDDVTVLSRDADEARGVFGGRATAATWAEPKDEPPPAEALSRRDGVVHLLGEPVGAGRVLEHAHLLDEKRRAQAGGQDEMAFH